MGAAPGPPRNTTYSTTATGSTDMLGLIAANFVQVYHPVRSKGNNIAPTFQDPQIHAAVLALNHSFIVQNYDEGSQLGTITVNGVIAQKWRGPVGTSGAAAPAISRTTTTTAGSACLPTPCA